MWRAEWTGAYPNLCDGIWKLWHDEEEIPTEKIIFNQDGHTRCCGVPAETFGVYNTWSFGEDYSEFWYGYEDGLRCHKWCDEYESWLSTIAPSREWPDIYAAFNAQDWRHGSCGGCI